MACSKCNKNKCCCPKTITKTGPRGKQGPAGPKGDTGPGFTPTAYYAQRSTYQTINNAGLVADDADLLISNVPAGTYIVLAEVNAVFNRDTVVDEDGSFSMYINSNYQRTTDLSDVTIKKKALQLVNHALITLASPGNIKVNYVMTQFIENPTTSVSLLTGSLTVLKIG